MSTSSSIEQNYQTLLAKPAGRARSAIFDSALRAISLLGDLFDNDRWENEKDDFNFRARQAGRSPKVVMHSPRVAQPADSPVVGGGSGKEVPHEKTAMARLDEPAFGSMDAHVALGRRT